MLTEPAIDLPESSTPVAARADARVERRRTPTTNVSPMPNTARQRPRRRITFFNAVLFLLAAIGVAFAIYVVKTGAKPVPVAQPVVPPPRAPFARYIAGSGLVEPASENILIGTSVPGMVTEVRAKIGQTVAAGDLLFKIDSRDLESELLVREAAIGTARARIPEAVASVDDAQQMFDTYNAVVSKGAVTKEEFNKRRFGLVGAKSRLEQAMAQVASAEALVAQTKVDIERRRIVAPVTGQVLQVKIRPGEYAQVGPLATPLMVLGQTDVLHVRTNIDENDAWRFGSNARAVAYVRGNPKLSTPLAFAHVEPYVVPKASLTGDPGERVDTRVLQVLFSFDPKRLNVFVGQQMDVYIEAPDTAMPTTVPSTDVSLPPTTAPN